MENGHIHLNLFSTLRQFLPEQQEEYPINDGMSISDLLIKLNVPIDEVRLVFINGKKAEIDTPLSNGDRVGIFPPIGGG